MDVAWVVETRGFSSRDKGEALAITPGRRPDRRRSLSGSLNDQLADLAERGRTGRLVDLHVGDLEAELAGLSCGGDARCLLVPAADLPDGLWERLRDRDPVCLVTRLDGDRVVGHATCTARTTIADAGEEAARLFGRGRERHAGHAGRGDDRAVAGAEAGDHRRRARSPTRWSPAAGPARLAHPGGQRRSAPPPA